jgi:hypothetical protein
MQSICLRIPETDVMLIDLIAKTIGITRSDLIRAAVQRNLKGLAKDVKAPSVEAIQARQAKFKEWMEE